MSFLGKRTARNKIVKLDELAWSHREIGNYAEAESLYQQLLVIAHENLKGGYPAIAGGMLDLAMVYTDMGTYDKAEPLFRQAIDIRCNSLG